MKNLVHLLWALAVLVACGPQANVEQDHKTAEAREDSAKYAAALAKQQKIAFRIKAQLETVAVAAGAEADAADDPAIWIHPTQPAKSLVLGTNKKEGLYAFTLQGAVQNYIKAGRINNVDVRTGFRQGNKEVSLVAGSNRSLNAISLFYIDHETGQLSDTVLNIPSQVDDVYGLSLYRQLPENRFFVFVNGKNGVLEQWEIQPGEPRPSYYKVRSLDLGSQPEGMVANDSLAVLYLGVEDSGIYRLAAHPDSTSAPVLLPGSTEANPAIAFDIEGLALFSHLGTSYLVASSQGNFSYAIFRVSGVETYLGSFVITAGTVDGVEETDGLEICTSSALPDFPGGLMVFQDGFNHDGDSLKSQNFKLLSLEQLFPLLQP